MVLFNDIKRAMQRTTGALFQPSDESGSKKPQNSHTQDQLVTQILPNFPSPARSSSPASIRSQDDETSANIAPILESQVGLTTQFNPVASQNKMSIAMITEPMIPNNIYNRISLLQHLQNGKQQENPPNHQAGQVINGFDVPKQNFLEKSDTHKELQNGKIQDTIRSNKSEGAELPAQEQRTVANPSSSQTQSPRKSNPSPKQQLSPTDSQPEGEVTSFQKHLTSPNTTPIREKATVSIEPAKTSPVRNNSQLKEPDQRKQRSEQRPWANMTKLSRLDVFIPKDQEELLDRSDSWIPADVSEPNPQGHVPTALLQEWNAKMSRLFYERRTDTFSKKVDLSRESRESEVENASPSQSRSLSDIDSDSESESVAGSWAQSPPHHFERPAAPPDSSPVERSKSKETPKEGVNEIANDAKNISNENKAETSMPASQTSDGMHVDSTQGTNVSVNDTQGQPPIQSPPSHCAVDSPSKDVQMEDEVPEVNDESDMETSIPQAFNVSNQDIVSQIESSKSVALQSPNPHSAIVAQIQIFNTPAAAPKHATGEREEYARNNSHAWVAQESSCESNKSSTQVVANSIVSDRDSSGQANQSHSLVADSQNIHEGTQESSLPSHQDGQRVLEVIPASFSNSDGLHTQSSLHTDDIDGSLKGPTENNHDSRTPESRPKRKVQELQTEENPSKRPKTISNGEIITNATEGMQYAELTDPLKVQHKYQPFNEESFRIYDLFKKTYPKYAGDFDHFHRMCCQIQTLHSREALPYHLWDAFVASYWLHYRDYQIRCIFAGKDFMKYEEFFFKVITKPKFYRQFSKRNLTRHTIRLVVSDHKVTTELPTVVDRGTQSLTDDVTNTCVTHESLSSPDKGSKDSLQNGADSIVAVDRPTQANIGIKLSPPNTFINHRPTMIDCGIQVNLEAPVPSRETNGNPVFSKDQNGIIEETEASPMIIEESTSDSIRANEAKLATTDNHETASLELGVEGEIPEEEVVDDTHHDNNQEEEDEEEEEDSNTRFELISRMRRENLQAVRRLFNAPLPAPPGAKDSPSHDYNTPFKNWARDDQNFRLERRRRGGKKLACDKDGNILFEEYPRAANDDDDDDDDAGNESFSFRNWRWFSIGIHNIS